MRLPLATLNRHGLVAGATGTGKTKTLQLVAEQLSAAGVPVVLADVKGDLSGLAAAGEANDKVSKRSQELGDDWAGTAFPVQFLSLGTGGKGSPIRATITSFGPVLLSKVLGLNETQESTLGLIFHWADQRGLALLDTKDLRSVITHLTSDEGKADLKGIGGVSAATAGVILRSLSNLEAQGGEDFFGEPELDVHDLMRAADGKGVVTLLELDNLQAKPALFSTFLMWLLAELFEELPEEGDLDKPKLVFFFDEAHLLFNDASKAFLERIEQTVKLIRSKGVGVFFCTQLPTDIPNNVLSQLGARIQHALRAFTPDDQAALAKTVKTYPKTKFYELDTALTSLGIGEAIVTVLSERGAPTPVAWTRLRAPRSKMGSIGRRSRGLGRRVVRPAREVRRDDRPGVGVREAGREDPRGSRTGGSACRGSAGSCGSGEGEGRAGAHRVGDEEPGREVVHAVRRERAGPGDHARAVRQPEALRNT